MSSDGQPIKLDDADLLRISYHDQEAWVVLRELRGFVRREQERVKAKIDEIAARPNDSSVPAELRERDDVEFSRYVGHWKQIQLMIELIHQSCVRELDGMKSLPVPDIDLFDPAYYAVAPGPDGGSTNDDWDDWEDDDDEDEGAGDEDK